MLRSTSVVITTVRRVAIDRVVAGQQADPADAVVLAEVMELLVRQRLDRSGVERPLAGRRSGPRCAYSATTVLPLPGRRGDHDVAAGVEGVDGVELESVEREGVAGEDLVAVGRTRSSRCRAQVAPLAAAALHEAADARRAK